MAKYNVSKSFQWAGTITDKVGKVMRMFGVSYDRLVGHRDSHRCEVEFGDGDIVFITGPSGAGKSVLLREFERELPADERINLSDIELSADRTLVDCIEGDFLTAINLLSTAGLNDVFCVLNQPANLSDGQKYRYRLAMALAAGKKYIFADEFCTNLDSITACVISCNIRRYANRQGVTFILASVRQDMLAELCPDVIVEKRFDEQAKVTYKKMRM